MKKDESQQWKLVAGEMLDIVKGIKMEGKTGNSRGGRGCAMI
jgi:hypothetical protein